MSDPLTRADILALDEAAADALLDAAIAIKFCVTPFDKLPRNRFRCWELEALRMRSEGMRRGQIAEVMNLSPERVGQNIIQRRSANESLQRPSRGFPAKDRPRAGEAVVHCSRSGR